MPDHQRTVDTVLRMACDRLNTSLLLIDFSGQLLNEATWPRTAADELAAALPALAPSAITEDIPLQYSTSATPTA